MNDMFYKSLFLIDCETLAGQLDDPGLKIFDCTQRLVRDPKLYVRAEPCKAEYAEAHIPGAGYLDILAELSDRSKRWRYMMPAADVLAGAFAKRGIGKDTRVVLYDTDGMMWSTRVWWQLRAIGFDNAAVLDGAPPYILHALLQHGADPDLPTRGAETPLCCCSAESARPVSPAPAIASNRPSSSPVKMACDAMKP